MGLLTFFNPWLGREKHQKICISSHAHTFALTCPDVEQEITQKSQTLRVSA